MTIITATPASVDQLLDARVVQTRSRFHDHLQTMDPGSLADWEDVVNLKEDYATATHAQQQHFIIQHHLAKTILSSS